MNICFIGMSGAGKSYVGKQFAQTVGLSFIDIDGAMEVEFGKSLPEILQSLGDDKFLEAQAEQITDLKGVDNMVISPGGSVVYSDVAMEFLREYSTVVYLQTPYSVIAQRVADTPRGIVGLGSQTLEELYNSRTRLYETWADITLDTVDKSADELCAELIRILENKS